MVKMMNKRGGEKLLTFWWFAILTLVVIGIVGGVSLMSYKEIDVKRYEAETLSVKLERCLVDLGKLKIDVLKNCGDLNRECGLNDEMFKGDGAFFYDLELTNSNGARVLSCRDGNLGLKPSCLFDADIKVRTNKFPVCSERNVSLRYYEDKWIDGNVKIVTGSNQNGRVAK
ncbi:MAG: hypothetical protein AABX11_06970 [Nanoarchaeota archaeon]